MPPEKKPRAPRGSIPRPPPVRRTIGTRSRSNRFKFNPSGSLLRHAEQVAYDATLDSISKNGVVLPFATNKRPNLDPRGIENPGQHCYQNACYQNLMHTPAFLRWILTHTQTPNCVSKKDDKPIPCVKCNMKSFVQNYWGPQRADIPISAKASFLCNIKQAAWNSSGLEHWRQEDTYQFYEWIVGQMDDENDPAWHNQWHALQGISVQGYMECKTCHAERPGPNDPPETFLTMGFVDIADQVATPIKSVEQVLDEWMNHNTTEARCHSAQCNGVDRIQNTRKWITAAPAVLKIQLKIFNWAAGATKIFNIVDIDEELNLTKYQEVDAVPLWYKLTGVIAHSGPAVYNGHYVGSVRGLEPGKYWNVNDSRKEAFDLEKFLANPHRPKGYEESKSSEGMQVYMLTYIRDQSYVENMDKWTKNRMLKALK